MSDMDVTANEVPPAATVVSGKLVVIGMFAFGLLLTAALYTYWDFHTRPFRPLQEVIAKTIPGSSPRVLGGRHKSHRAEAPNTLRMIVQVDYNPLEASNEAKRDELARTILTLAKSHHDLAPYQQVELHLEHRVPERPGEVWSSVRTPAEWDAFQLQSEVTGRSS